MANAHDTTPTLRERAEDISVSLESVQSILELCHRTLLGGTSDPRAVVRVETALPLAIRELERLGEMTDQLRDAR